MERFILPLRPPHLSALQLPAPKRQLNFKDSVLQPSPNLQCAHLLLTKWATQLHFWKPTRTASSVNFLSPLNLAAGTHEPAIYFMSAVGHSQFLGPPSSTKAGQVNPHLLTWQYGSKSKLSRLELLHCLRILFYLQTLGQLAAHSRPAL